MLLPPFGLAQHRFACLPAIGFGLAQQRSDLSLVGGLEVGMPTAALLIYRLGLGMIIGVDPHKLSHTASAVDPLSNTSDASLRVDASVAGYRESFRYIHRPA